MQQIETRLLVTCIIKPAVPRLTIFLAYSIQPVISFKCKSLIFNSDLHLRKKITKEADKICEITVAIAAPLIPSSKTKIKIGSKIKLAMAPIATESMPVVA